MEQRGNQTSKKTKSLRILLFSLKKLQKRCINFNNKILRKNNSLSSPSTVGLIVFAFSHNLSAEKFIFCGFWNPENPAFCLLKNVNCLKNFNNCFIKVLTKKKKCDAGLENRMKPELQFLFGPAPPDIVIS